MAETLKKLASGTLGTTEATLYTVPASTKTIVKSIILCNKTASAATATIKFAGVEVIAAHTIKANDTLCVQITGVLEASATIAGLASAASAINYYVSGVEVV